MMTINELKKSLEENGREAIESLITKIGTKDENGNFRVELESFNRVELVKRFNLTNPDEWEAEAEAKSDRNKGVSDKEISDRIKTGYYLKKYVTDIIMKSITKAFEFKEDAFVEKCVIEMDKDNVIRFNGEVVVNDETSAEETKEAVLMANSAPVVQHDSSCTCGCNSNKTLKEKIEFVNKKSNKFDAIKNKVDNLTPEQLNNVVYGPQLNMDMVAKIAAPIPEGFYTQNIGVLSYAKQYFLKLDELCCQYSGRLSNEVQYLMDQLNMAFSAMTSGAVPMGSVPSYNFNEIVAQQQAQKAYDATKAQQVATSNAAQPQTTNPVPVKTAPQVGLPGVGDAFISSKGKKHNPADIVKAMEDARKNINAEVSAVQNPQVPVTPISPVYPYGIAGARYPFPQQVQPQQLPQLPLMANSMPVFMQEMCGI